MKKVVCMYLMLTIFLNFSTKIYAKYIENPLNMNREEYNSLIDGCIARSVDMLSELDIVRNPHEKWQPGNYITRRNAFEVMYVVITEGNRLLASPYGGDNTYVRVTDVDEGTYDYALANSLVTETNLLNGKLSPEGKLIADFNTFLTYNEALTMISRLFTSQHWRYDEQIRNIINGYDTEFPYYVFAQEIGLINSNTLIDYTSLSINISKMNEYISAYEFLHLVYSSLFIPCLKNFDGPTRYGFRYIDSFIMPKTDFNKEINYNRLYIP